MDLYGSEVFRVRSSIARGLVDSLLADYFVFPGTDKLKLNVVLDTYCMRVRKQMSYLLPT